MIDVYVSECVYIDKIGICLYYFYDKIIYSDSFCILCDIQGSYLLRGKQKVGGLSSVKKDCSDYCGKWERMCRGR